jgi:hypothetical protein
MGFGFGLPAFGFWIFIGAIIVATIWASARQKAEKHETLRRIVEKTGTIDEGKLKELFKEDPSENDMPGATYRALRIFGTITMFIGAGVAIVFLIPTLVGKPIEWWYGGLAISAGIATVGLGLFFSSRFAESPPATRNEPPAR